MKILIENWRKYLTEDDDVELEGPTRTGDMPPHLVRKQNRLKDAQALLKSMGFSVRRELGRGVFGVVYEIENSRTGQRLAAKVVPANNAREIENYKFAMEEKAFMPEKYAKYLPDVKQLMTGRGSTIILMELLEPLDPQTAQELFAAQDAPTASKKPERILKDSEAIAEITEKAIEHNRILDQMKLTPEQYSEITSVAVNAATQAPLSGANDLVNTIYSAAAETLTFQSPAISRAFEKALKDTILYYFDKQIIPVHQPEEDEDHYDTWTSGGLSKTSALFPEAEGLLAAMKYFMQDKGWKPKDVHIKNVMRRPDTKDFVIVDLGLFERGIYENLNLNVKKKDYTMSDAYMAFILNASMQDNIPPRVLLDTDNEELLQHIKRYNHRKDDISDEELYNYIKDII